MERPKELPRVVVDDHNRARHEARRKADHDSRVNAIAFGSVAIGFLRHLFSHGGSDGGNVVLRGGASKRKQAEIIGELKAFFEQRPRPWRPKSFAHRIRRRAYTAPKVRASIQDIVRKNDRDIAQAFGVPARLLEANACT